MFREKYKKDNQKIHLDDQAKAYLLYKLKNTPQPEPPRASGGMYRLVAATLCLALVVGCCSWFFAKSPAPLKVQSFTAADYQELYNLNKTLLSKIDYKYQLYTETVTDNETVTIPAQGNSAPPTATDDATDISHSTTNTQYADVDEADIVKTDGRYIYTLSFDHNRISILKADGADTQVLSTIAIPYKERTESGTVLTSPESFYLSGDRLVLIVSQSYAQKGYYGALIYDVSDRQNPKKQKTVLQSGAAETTRLIDGVLYMVSRYYINNKLQQDTPETYVPHTVDDEQVGLCPAEDITVLQDATAACYTVLGAIEVESGQRLDQKSVFGTTSGVYANTQNIYAISAGVAEGQTVTDLVRFSIQKGQIEVTATGRVAGTTLNQFSMDEQGGVLRIVTTSQKVNTAANGNYAILVGEPKNNLYLLDQELQILGKMEDLAAGERVYSVRFMGNIGYFVTFRETDPLFSVDLSDPQNPKVLGELKIPGFSNYLHPYDEGLLLGLGMDADENGITKGLKLSMFKVTDPTHVTEAHTLLLDANYSEAQYNHKAILVDTPKNLIGFSTVTAYLLYEYDPQTGFQCRATLPIDSYNARGVYVGDLFYLCTDTAVQFFTLYTFTPLAEIAL